MDSVHPPPASPPFTKTDWERLPEGFPAQLVDGWLIKDPAPAYGHQVLASRILRALQDASGLDRAVVAPVDVFVDELNVFQPDVIVLRERLPDVAKGVRAPLLAVEVRSPSTAERDREVKRTRLLASGTGEVWLVDPETRTIEVHDTRRCRLARGDQRIESVALPGFALVPAELFAPPR